MKILAGLLFLLNTILFATYYAVAKEALGRFDPVIFTFFEMQLLVPAALFIIALSWKYMTRDVVKRGVMLGSSLCLALFTIAIALKYTTATSTAFFPALNGFLAALIARFFLRRPTRRATWIAGVLSTAGTTLIIASTAMDDWRGISIAFLGGLFFTFYVFLSEQGQEGAHPKTQWPLFGIELLTMAGWASLVVLLFGNWQAVHPVLPRDALALLYVAGACTFLPAMIAVLMQKYISAVTVSFIYILEPILAAVIAAIYLHETLPRLGYLGGALVVAGAVIHTLGTAFSRASASGEATATKQEMGQWQPLQEHYVRPERIIDENVVSLAQDASIAAWNVRSHRQTGTLPYRLNRDNEKTLVRQRRKVRLQRLEQEPPAIDSPYGDTGNVVVERPQGTSLSSVTMRG